MQVTLRNYPITKHTAEGIYEFRDVLIIKLNSIGVYAERLTVKGWELCNDPIGFKLSIHWKWVFSEKHFYYDCPHCAYEYGPFTYIKDGNWECRECTDRG